MILINVKNCKKILIILIILLTGINLSGQFSPRIKSPVVNTDLSVTFSVRATNAREVLLNFGAEMKSYPMTKNDEGVWSTTIGPINPEYYTYSFLVDGLKILDPSNPEMQVGQAPVEKNLTY